ncbi:hypothetical protein PENTCL1PPCAC_6640, partial [Pristionchus entomophagus]
SLVLHFEHLKCFSSRLFLLHHPNLNYSPIPPSPFPAPPLSPFLSINITPPPLPPPPSPPLPPS